MTRYSACRFLAVATLLLWAALHRPAFAEEPAPPAVHVVSFGLYGGQDLFKREATAVAKVIARQYGWSGHVVVRANDSKNSEAGPTDLRDTLTNVAEGMDRDQDILFLFLTSHGTKDGIVISRRGDKRYWLLSPQLLKRLLDATGVRHRVVVLSACYAGVFAKDLARDTTLLITAADANHTSFGCSDDNKGDYTYFGDALFGESLRPGVPLEVAFRSAYQRIAKREAAERLPGSNPQLLGGKLVLEQLARVR